MSKPYVAEDFGLYRILAAICLGVAITLSLAVWSCALA